ncbi:MAG: PIG-L family deacetylase [Rubricoccaceae bacterium]
MSYLIVVAHPDDEVLGCGGTAAALTAAGHDVHCLIVCGDAEARQHRPSDEQLESDTLRSHAILGISPLAPGPFPNIRLNTVPHIEIVQFIEAAIQEVGATRILTHHPHDLNDDHLHTSRACQAAARLFQRRSDVPRLQSLHFIEVQSSTDWSFPGHSEPFRPDAFFEIRRAGVALKVKALEAYQGVMRPYPHPRSLEAIEGLAAYRGGEAGMDYAEAFQTAFQTLTPPAR